MFVKRLELFGFKSFADHTEIDFCEGITAVVGPNGAGKSNLVESFLWLLGEQSSSKLRFDKGKGFDDLIFRGTSERKPLGMVEVSLTFDNAGSALPYETDEVTVRRKYYRGKQSEYFINEQSARLKDITTLFFGTGLGKNTYSVIKQGTVETVANQQPEERRLLIEEAAGISKYIERRKEALRKLAESERNLSDVNMMIREVEKQYKTLKVQAERTEKYHKLNEERKRAQIDLNLLHISKAREMETQIREEIDKLKEREGALEKELGDLDDKKREEAEKFESTRSEVMVLQKESMNVFNEIRYASRMLESLSGQKANASHDLEETVKRKKALEEKFDAANEQLVTIEKERSTLHDNIAGLSAEQEQHDARKHEETQKIEAFRKRITEIDEQVKELRGRLESEREEQKELVDKFIIEIGKKKKDIEETFVYQNRDKLEHDIEIGFNNILQSIESKTQHILEFEEIGVTREYNEVNYKRLTEFVAGLNEKLDIEKKEVAFLKDIFLQYDRIKDPFMSLLFDEQGTYFQKEELDAKIANTEKGITRLQEEVDDLTKSIQFAQETIEKCNEKIASINVRLAAFRERSKGLTQSYERTTKERAEIENDLAGNAKKVESIENRMKNFESEIAGTSEKLDEMKKKQKKMETEVEKKQKALKKTEGNIADFEVGYSQKIKKMEQIRTSLNNFEVRFLNIKDRIKSIYDNFYENYSINLKDFEKEFEKKNIDEQKTKAKIEKLKEDIRRLGTINEMAREEFYETKERFEFLTKQREDLLSATKEINTAIEEINQDAASRFEETLTEINRNFQELFHQIFKGGKAELIVTDPSDMLTTGIDIKAEPPGKKMENVISSSGGELSLIAMALTFAIFKYRPSPFCILDEVDHALDGANVFRFKELIKTFSKNTQFLIITHNEVTASAANAYYGISTQADNGVSSLFSLKINEDGTLSGGGNVQIEE